jgi:G3E family GTPase
MSAARELVPVTVVTGFLGAGKSTLLGRILTERHGRRIAVIENEFAAENIDTDLLVAAGAEQIVQMTNGCVCCSIREDLRTTLTELARRRAAGEIGFDHVVIETTGLADPGPIAQTFFRDAEITRSYRPDAILTLVDARFAPNQLDEHPQVRRQIAFADRLFISKCDLVEEAALATLRARLRHLNPAAPQRRVHFGAVDLAEVFEVGGFNLRSDLDPLPDEASHDHCDAEDCESHHAHFHHDHEVGSVAFRSERPIDPARFARFINATVSSQASRLLRYKGVLCFRGEERRVILQGVHELMSYDVGQRWSPDDARTSKLVFIGLDLPAQAMLDALGRCVA